MPSSFEIGRQKKEDKKTQPSTSDISTLVIFLAQIYHNKKPLILKKSKQIIFKKCKLQSQLSKRFYNYFLKIIIF